MADLRELIQKVLKAKNKLELQNLKTQFLGKNSQISQSSKTWFSSGRTKKVKSCLS